MTMRTVLFLAICTIACAAIATRPFYERPPCTHANEKAEDILGLKGSVCAAPCSTYRDCPTTDLPRNATAQPTCTSGRCFLACGSGIGHCGVGARCGVIGAGIGICLYR